MPKATQADKKKKVRSVSREDAIMAFCRGKEIAGENAQLKVERGSHGELVLKVLKKSKWKEFCIYASVKPQSGETRKLIVMTPENGDPLLIRMVYGAFPHGDILWKKGLLPMKFEDATSINDNTALFTDDASTS